MDEDKKERKSFLQVRETYTQMEFQKHHIEWEENKK